MTDDELIIEFDDVRTLSAPLAWYGISFEEALTVFGDLRAVEYFDEHHSADEDRFVTLGMSSKMRVLLVVNTEQSGDSIRMISARRATKAETDEYVKG